MPKERALIEIRLAGLSQGIHKFDFTCAAGDFKDSAVKDAGFSDGISVHAIVEKNDDEIAVSMETTAKAALSCDLCLAPVALELKGTYRVYYIYEQAPGQEEAADEYRLIDRNSVSIDLTEDVRETLLLSVPMKATCTDNPDCHIYLQEGSEDADNLPDSSWQESLEKLKDKYR
ncbi:MAG: DUF177 domain-containing protein [Chlorobiaceae bacterium]|nr:DUF177 domain-containing protein [Chlorobiaceae bacterium]